MSNTPMGVNPQVLGAITSVAQVAKQASQTAQTAQQMAANNAKQIASLSSSGSAIGVPTQIRNGSVIINSGAAVSWTTKPSGAPSGASWVLLTGYAYFSTPDNANVELDFRSDGSGATICACRYRSVLGTYSGNAAINVWVPIGANGTIQYQIINGSYSTLTITPVAYL